MQAKFMPHLSLENKRVLLRVDFNVPIKNTIIKDDERIQVVLPTIKMLLDKKAAIIILSHLGRPKGKAVPSLSLKPVADKLSQLLNQKVLLISDYLSEQGQQSFSNLKAGDIAILENLRFHQEEEDNNPYFAQQLSKLGDVFINDAFGTMHRKHASIVGIPKYLPSGIGLLVQKEITMLSKLLDSPPSPFLVIAGGAKIKTKAALLESILDRADEVVIGGKMAHTFLQAQGITTGLSDIESDSLDLARHLLDKAKRKGVSVYLPFDFKIAYKIGPEEPADLVSKSQPFPDKAIALDIGPETTQMIIHRIQHANTIFWNGPLGLFEFRQFASGTLEVAKAIGQSKAISMIGGGDSIRAVKQLNIQNKITHLSSGGGASLNFLGGDILPGLKVIL